MARAKVEIGLAISYLVDIDYEPPDADELGDAPVDALERDDCEAITDAIGKALADDPRYEAIVDHLAVTPTVLRSKFPDTHIDARLIPLLGLPDEVEV